MDRMTLTVPAGHAPALFRSLRPRNNARPWEISAAAAVAAAQSTLRSFFPRANAVNVRVDVHVEGAEGARGEKLAASLVPYADSDEEQPDGAPVAIPDDNAKDEGKTDPIAVDSEEDEDELEDSDSEDSDDAAVSGSESQTDPEQANEAKAANTEAPRVGAPAVLSERSRKRAAHGRERKTSKILKTGRSSSKKKSAAAYVAEFSNCGLRVVQVKGKDGNSKPDALHCSWCAVNVLRKRGSIVQHIKTKKHQRAEQSWKVGMVSSVAR